MMLMTAAKSTYHFVPVAKNGVSMPCVIAQFKDKATADAALRMKWQLGTDNLIAMSPDSKGCFACGQEGHVRSCCPSMSYRPPSKLYALSSKGPNGTAVPIPSMPKFNRPSHLPVDWSKEPSLCPQLLPLTNTKDNDAKFDDMNAMIAKLKDEIEVLKARQEKQWSEVLAFQDEQTRRFELCRQDIKAQGDRTESQFSELKTLLKEKLPDLTSIKETMQKNTETCNVLQKSIATAQTDILRIKHGGAAVQVEPAIQVSSFHMQPLNGQSLTNHFVNNPQL